MKILYQGLSWAYSHNASLIVSKKLKLSPSSVDGKSNFSLVWQGLDQESIAVLPIENSYAWSVHENMYNFLRNDCKIIWEITLDINHCLASKEEKLENITQAFSHPQAVSQCYEFLRKNNIKWFPYSDTAWAAKFAEESDEKGISAICSEYSAELYWLNIIEKNIQDQKWNKTRFLLVVKKESKITYPDKINKISLIFETKNIPASLYKCLWWFATNKINLSKIESLPSLKNPFNYMFWLDVEGNLNENHVKTAIEELKFFTKDIQILWEY